MGKKKKGPARFLGLRASCLWKKERGERRRSSVRLGAFRLRCGARRRRKGRALEKEKRREKTTVLIAVQLRLFSRNIGKRRGKGKKWGKRGGGDCRLHALALRRHRTIAGRGEGKSSRREKRALLMIVSFSYLIRLAILGR